MREQEPPNLSLLKQIKIEFKARLRQFLRSLDGIPFAVRALTAPDGQLVSKVGKIVEGKVVSFAGRNSDKVILTEKGEIVFPNKTAGDIIRPSI